MANDGRDTHERCPCGCGIFIPNYATWYERHFGPDHSCRLCPQHSIQSTHRDAYIEDKNGERMFCPLCALHLLEPQFRRHSTRLARANELFTTLVAQDFAPDDGLIRRIEAFLKGGGDPLERVGRRPEVSE